MSMESARGFIAKIKTDEDFARRVRECKDAEDRMAFARQAGFDFTADEIQRARQELSDSELDRVAGGVEVECEKHWNHQHGFFMQ